MATFPAAAVALDGGDPRASLSGPGIAEYSQQNIRSLHDPNTSIEEYFHWAKLTREDERNLDKGHHPKKTLLGFKNKKIVETPDGRKTSVTAIPSAEHHDISSDEKHPEVSPPSYEKREQGSDDIAPVTSSSPVTDAEWYNAQRAARTATWGAMFYLITTDILGPFSVPWAFSQMGYGEGVALYTVFGVLAFYTGWQIWRMFLHLDSYQYPMKTFGDIAFRVFGTFARHVVNILQSIQLLFNVGVIIIGNGQGLWQVNEKICFAVCCVIWTVLGMTIGQIRTLQRFGWIANLAIWLNVTVIIMTMAVVSHSAPNYEAANGQNDTPLTANPANQPPVMTSGSPPPGAPFTSQVTGLMQAVYSYGGAMLYCEFLSEMRRPMDFWKAIVCAETFIYCCYLFFGVYVYSYQGQYTVNPANQGMGLQGALKAGNIISFVSALIAAALYGNIGIKVIYQNVLKEFFGFPDLTSPKGKFIWIALVPIYWGCAFVLAAAIPAFSALSALVAALCIMQFTYTFPPILMLGMTIQRDAIRYDQGEGFDPATGQPIRHDHGFKRWVRGFLAKGVVVKIWNFILFLGACCCMVLGVYSAIISIIAAYANGSVTAFSCTPAL